MSTPETTDLDDELVAVPRWVAGVLAEEVEMNTECGGQYHMDSCPRCEAIRLAKEAYENGSAI